MDNTTHWNLTAIPVLGLFQEKGTLIQIHLRPLQGKHLPQPHSGLKRQLEQE